MKKRQVVIRKETSHRSSSNQIVRTVRYGECQKNHAASIGGYAVDGCREFMAGGAEGTAAALSCAACGCHRNFHRQEFDGEVVSDSSSLSWFIIITIHQLILFRKIISCNQRSVLFSFFFSKILIFYICFRKLDCFVQTIGYKFYWESWPTVLSKGEVIRYM